MEYGNGSVCYRRRGLIRDICAGTRATSRTAWGSYDIEKPRLPLAAHHLGRSRRLCWGLDSIPTPRRPAASPIDPSLYSGLKWRNIGPFRAGRVASVTGVIGQPGVFYMGLPAGGVWKTTSAGTTWFPVFDDVKDVAAVGSIQVAPSDPNVIYAGTGDLVQGGAINEGNGVYKSTDAGKTWQHLPGLENTKNIPALLVDPKDPSLVLIAAQGNIREKTDQRGVFRTTDGGKTWTRTLKVDDEIGAQSIAWAFDNPQRDARHDDPSLHVARRARRTRRERRRRPRGGCAGRAERDIDLQIDR